MENHILKDVSKNERLQILSDSADKKESFTYPRHLNAEEVTYLKDEFTKNAIELARKEESKKDFMTEWKSEVKPIKLEMSSQMNRIRSKVEEITEDVFLVADQPAKTMGYYNGDGILVYQRPLMPEEQQLSIVDKSNLRTAN